MPLLGDSDCKLPEEASDLASCTNSFLVIGMQNVATHHKHTPDQALHKVFFATGGES